MKRLPSKLTYSNVISTLALFLVLAGGTALAASQVLPKNSVGTKQLKKGSVGSRQLQRGSVNGAKVKNGSLNASDFGAGQLPTGPAGPRGATGAKGDTGARGERGATGPRGPSNAFYAFSNTTGTNSKTISLTVPPGNYIASASMFAVTPEASTGFGQVDCSLGSGADTSGEIGEVDQTVMDAPTGSGFNYNVVTTETPQVIPAGGGTISFSCARIGGTAEIRLYQARIIAMQAETLTKP